MSSKQLARKTLRLLTSSLSSDVSLPTSDTDKKKRRKNEEVLISKKKESILAVDGDEKSVNPFALVRKENGRLGGSMLEKKMKAKQRKQRAISRQALEYYQKSLNSKESELKSKILRQLSKQ